ncbi:hypothetical protein Tco_0272425 [Tanacetum coccineum]
MPMNHELIITGLSIRYENKDTLVVTILESHYYKDLSALHFEWVSDEEPEAPKEAPPSSDYVPGPEHPPSPNYVPGPEHPPSPDYVPGPEEPEQAPLSPDYVPEPEYPEYLVPSDVEVPIEDQPNDALPTALLPGYVADSDPKEDLEEDPEEDPADYPADGGDDDDESYRGDADDEDKEEASEEEDDDEEEEHLALTDSFVVPVVNPVSSAEDTEAFKTDESAPTPPSPRRRRAGISVRLPPPMAASMEARIAEYAIAPTSPSPPLSPLCPLSSPLPQIPSPPLPLPSPPTTSPTYVKAPLGYRAVEIQLRDASPSTHHTLEIPSPPLLLPSTTHRGDIPEADMPLRKRARFTAPTGRFEVGESSSATAARQARHTLAHRVDYGFLDNVDAGIRASKSRAMTAIREVNERVTDLAATQRQDAQEIYRNMIRDEDRPTSHIQHEHDRFRELVRTVKAGPQDGPADAGSSC